MNNYDNYIEFTENVIKRVQFTKSQTKDLDDLIQRIEQRQNDSNLYLAVIGEFSSGKSTFINALLRDNLLKTSALVTTSVATRLYYGKSIDIKVKFANLPSMININKKNINVGCSIFVGVISWLIIIVIFKLTILPMILLLVVTTFMSMGVFSYQPDHTKNLVTSDDIISSGIDIREFIHKITSEEEIAKEIVSLDISHPALFLQNNIVIIDLPGTNATNTRHVEVTQAVVSKEADLAMIIIPATQPLTDSLVEFLRVTVSSCLHRCIFIVSRMDQISNKEHNRMLTNVRGRLLDRLEVSTQKLYWCSAQVIMDDLTGEIQAIKNPQFWIDQFSQMQVEIIERLHTERQEIINENIERLLTQLLNQLQGHLYTQWHHYREREAQIQRETIQDIETFKNEQYRECINKVDQAVNRTENNINDSIEKFRDQTMTKVKSAIFGASDWDDLKYIVNYKISNILRENQNLLSKNIEKECHNLSQSVQEVGRFFDKKFTEVYQNLRALGGRIQNQSVFSSNSISIDAYSVISSAQELNISNFSNAIKGFFSHFFPGLLDNRKQEVWDEIRPKIYNYFSEVKKQVQPTVNKDADNIKNVINQRINAYITHYKSVVDDMLNQQKKELQRLNKLQVTIQSDLAEIERRQLQIRINSS